MEWNWSVLSVNSAQVQIPMLGRGVGGNIGTLVSVLLHASLTASLAEAFAEAPLDRQVKRRKVWAPQLGSMSDRSMAVSSCVCVRFWELRAEAVDWHGGVQGGRVFTT